jgi:hypothetical protein
MPNPHTTGTEPPSGGEGDAALEPGPANEKDIVEVAGEGSFPGSDPPSWSQALAR